MLWSIPVALVAIAVLLFVPGGREASRSTTAAGTRWWPDWRNPLVWRLGLMLGSVNGVYFATNFFLPDYLVAGGHGNLVDYTLTVLNLGQLPASFVMLAYTGRWIRRRSVYVASGALTLAGLAGTLIASGPLIVFWAGFFGFFSTITFVLAFALPSLLSERHDVHRVAAGMFTLSYTCAVLTPVIGGYLWDLTRMLAMAFAPILVWPLVTALMAFQIDFRPRESAAE